MSLSKRTNGRILEIKEELEDLELLLDRDGNGDEETLEAIGELKKEVDSLYKFFKEVAPLREE